MVGHYTVERRASSLEATLMEVCRVLMVRELDMEFLLEQE